MRRLDAGQATPHLDRHCISCFACNAFCPHDADPYGRILQRFQVRYWRHGLPQRAHYLMPTADKSFRTDVLRSLPADERALVRQWAEREPAGDVLYPGCNLITSAFLTFSGIFDELTIAGSLDLCCGEMYFRMGLLEKARRIAERLSEYYADKPIKRMFFVCPAGYHMFTRVLPERFGAEFNFEKIFIADYLLDQFDHGRLNIRRPLDQTVVVHDSCHARVLGPGFMDQVRRLFRRLGVSLVEAEHNREGGYCCGIAAGAPRQSPVDLAQVALSAHRDYKDTSAGQVATYCTGCYLILGMLQPPRPFGLPVTHLLALVAEAVGRPVPARLAGRTRRMAGNIGLNTLPLLLSPRRFWVK